MDRRVFIAIVGGSILSAPLVAGAQQAERPHRVGFLTGPTGTGTTFFDAFRQGFKNSAGKKDRTSLLNVGSRNRKRYRRSPQNWSELKISLC
jgi:hypothetical protein